MKIQKVTGDKQRKKYQRHKINVQVKGERSGRGGYLKKEGNDYAENNLVVGFGGGAARESSRQQKGLRALDG